MCAVVRVLAERKPSGSVETLLAYLPLVQDDQVEEAIREGERAVELMPVGKSAVEGAKLRQYLAVIYAWTGDKDRAIESLAEITKLPVAELSYGYLRLNPLWDPLRGDPRFEAIVGSLAPK